MPGTAQCGAPAGGPEAVTCLACIRLVVLLCAASGAPPVVSTALTEGLAAKQGVGHQDVVDGVHDTHAGLEGASADLCLDAGVGGAHRYCSGGCHVGVQGGAGS